MALKQSAGVFLLRRDKSGEVLFLLLRGKRSWDLPKGGLEPGETPLAAAKRETFEETGLLEIDWLKIDPIVVSYSLGKNKQKIVTVYLATTLQKDVTTSKEHSDFCWFPLGEALKTLPERFLALYPWVQSLNPSSLL